MDPKCRDCNNKKIYAKKLCSRCYGKYSMRRFRLNNPEKDKQRKRNWFLKNKEKVCFQRKKSRILKKYGITIEQYDEWKNKQKEACLICENKRDLVLDHDHTSGKNRGMLCDTCNRGLGYFKDNPDLLIKAAKYILDNRKENYTYGS